MNDKGKKQPLLVLAGPTAVGKTELSLRMAEELNGAVISADSMQVYRQMDIGSAKIMPEERRGIPHYLIDVLDPEEDFNVFRFQQMAGENTHHILEACFKGMGRALAQAVRIDEAHKNEVPSTKGVLVE